jgi:hypothetical protein
MKQEINSRHNSIVLSAMIVSYRLGPHFFDVKFSESCLVLMFVRYLYTFVIY